MFNTHRYSLVATLASMEEKLVTNSIDTQFINDTDEFKDGNVLFKTLPKRTSFINLTTRSKIICARSAVPTHYHWNRLFKDVTDNIITTNEPMELNSAIQKSVDLYDALGDRLYGILLISTGMNKKRINPFHPLTAMSIANDEELRNKHQWILAIYTYTDKYKLDTAYCTSNADPDIIQENLVDLINCYINRKSTNIKVVNKSYNQQHRKVDIEYCVEHHPEEDAHRMVSVVTHQVLTAGTIAPYYGTSIIQKNYNTGEVSGIPVSPMLSSNISYTFSTNSYDHENTAIGKMSIMYGAVCTGSLNNATSHGLRSLTHSNAKSPYTTTIIQSGALAYVDACIQKSIEIYKLTKTIKDNSNEETTDRADKLSEPNNESKNILQTTSTETN